MRGIIFDFDGVIADSEVLANTVLAEFVTRLGVPTTLDHVLQFYMGKRWPEVIALIETSVGGKVPGTFSDDLKTAIFDRFRTDLKEIQGAGAFIRRFAGTPRCIASSSSLDRLTLCLEVLRLADAFSGQVFSGDLVQRGKPHPDLFLLAAERMKLKPADCIVIEDSENGVRAAVAAGMAAVGLCAGAHIRSGHHEKLGAAGATHVVQSWDEAVPIVSRFLAIS